MTLRPVTFIGGPKGNRVTHLPMTDPSASPHMCSEEAGGFHHWWRRGDGTGEDLVYTYAGHCNEANGPHSWHDHQPLYVADDDDLPRPGLPFSTFEKVGFFALRIAVGIGLFFLITSLPPWAGVVGVFLLFGFVLNAIGWMRGEVRILRPKPCVICGRDNVEVVPLPVGPVPVPPAPRAWWDLRPPARMNLDLDWVCQDDVLEYIRSRSR